MKKLINSALFFEQLKRFWPIGALSMLTYLLFVLQPLYFPSGSASQGNASRIMTQLIGMSHPFLVMSMVAVPFIAALALFSYSYRGASATAYHALPVNRRQLFFTHGLVGLTFILVPLLILSLVLLVPVQYVSSGWSWNAGHIELSRGQVINTFPRVVGFFLRNALGFITYFAIFVLAASLAGNKVIAVLLSGVFVFAPMGLVGLFEVVGSYYIFGFGAISFNAVEIVAAYSNPVGWMMAYESPQPMSLVPFFISYSLITLACLCLAFLTNKLRPHERAGDTVAFLPVKRVLIFLFALSGMVIMGVFWLNAVGSRVGYYFGFVIGFVIAYFIAQMIAEKTFRVGDKAKQLISYAVAAAGLYALLLLVAGIGFWGYVRRVPTEQEITGVIIQQTRNPSRIMQGVYREGMPLHRDGLLLIDDPETIAWVREIHESIVAERRYLQRSRWNDTNFTGGWTAPFNITYRLDNGRFVHRSYLLTQGLHRDVRIDDLRQSGPVVLSQIPALFRPEVIEFIQFGGTWSNVYRPSEIAELVEVIREDIMSSVPSAGAVSVSLRIRDRYLWERLGNTWFNVPRRGYTFEWLRENGYIE